MRAVSLIVLTTLLLCSAHLSVAGEELIDLNIMGIPRFHRTCDRQPGSNRRCILTRAESPRTHSRSMAGMAFLVVGLGLPYASAEDVNRFTKWEHFVIAESLPGAAWGTGGIGVADFDGHGDLEVALSRREPETAYCFERKTDSTWMRHEIGTSERLKRTLGAAALDMDQDGWIDVAFWGVWFKNPGQSVLGGTRWEVIGYDGGGHDVVAADVNGDGALDLITYDGHDLCWFDPANKVAKTTIAHGRNDHGGIAPRGIGDLNADGSGSTG